MRTLSPPILAALVFFLVMINTPLIDVRATFTNEMRDHRLIPTDEAGVVDLNAVKKIRDLNKGTAKQTEKKVRADEVCNTTRTFPCVCSQSADGLTVNCSGRSLISVPAGIPDRVTLLILSHNRIRDIPAGTFRNLSRLGVLNLSYNELSHMGSGVFSGLNRLTKLLLNENPWHMTAKTFSDDVFTPLANLTWLNLKTAFPSDNRQSQYPDSALSKLPRLETLLINGLTNKVFGKGFVKISSLKTLDLSHSPSFESMSKDTFVNFKNISLKTLNLSHCDLTQIHRETFSNLPQIDTIDYSHNVHLEIKGVGISTYGLQNSRIRKIVMQRVHVFDSLTIVTKEDFQYLNQTGLEELYMDNNTIGQIIGLEPVLALPLSIRNLSFSWNNIQSYKHQVFLLLRLQNAEQLDASNQEVYDVTNRRTNGHQENISSRQVQKVSTRSFDSILSHQLGPRLEDVSYLKHSRVLSDVRIELDEEALPEFYLPPNLWKVDCSKVYKIRFTVPELKLKNSSLEFVNFAYNGLNKWKGPIRGAESIRYLDLTGNGCNYVSDMFFAYMTGLETLHIGQNKLGKHFTSDIVFYNLTSLKRLYMEDNQLETLEFNLFSRLSNLTELRLSGNYLTDWNMNMSGLTKLQTLDLSHNKLQTLPPSLCHALDDIFQFSAVLVDIQDNPFQCVCDTEHFIEWLARTKVTFRNLASTFCRLANGTTLPLSANRVILNTLKRRCRSYAALIGGLCSTVFLFLVVLAVKVVHRQRWKLRYLWYMATNWRKRTGYQSLDSVAENPFGYDAFVSYEDAHLNFIREQIIPRLETESGLKLCIDKREFIPGLFITDNILHAITTSRKTVVLLSRAFLKSKWCMYELNMARMEGIYNGRECHGRPASIARLEERPLRER
ncbi:toll-like receptor 4 isoform X2 [Liolophura sinensis]|uniref:toll-like receptor 4 isoform X2 n=1 Tax=Liolophura sinensis TaxID=3198878 RepID=UPI003158F942